MYYCIVSPTTAAMDAITSTSKIIIESGKLIDGMLSLRSPWRVVLHSTKVTWCNLVHIERFSVSDAPARFRVCNAITLCHGSLSACAYTTWYESVEKYKWNMRLHMSTNIIASDSVLLKLEPGIFLMCHSEITEIPTYELNSGLLVILIPDIIIH